MTISIFFELKTPPDSCTSNSSQNYFSAPRLFNLRYMMSHCGHFSRIPSSLVKGFAFDQDGPRRACQLFSQRSHHNTVGPSLQQSLNQNASGAPGDNRSGTVLQHFTNIVISPVWIVPTVWFFHRSLFVAGSTQATPQMSGRLKVR